VKRILARVVGFVYSEKGQGMVEYGLILALVAVVVVGILAAIGTRLGNTFTQVRDTLPQ